MPKEHHIAGHQRMERLDRNAAVPTAISGASRSQVRAEQHEGGFTTDFGATDHLTRTERYANLKFDKELTFDKITDVYHAGVSHDEDQPSHLHILDTEICATRCAEEYGNPCQRFCPAQVYEMEHDPESGRRELKVNFSNCVHCKTCDIADPYQIINWVTPEGGGGPNYKGM
jgi:ferredoxin-like protein FixX